MPCNSATVPAAVILVEFLHKCHWVFPGKAQKGEISQKTCLYGNRVAFGS